MSANPASQIMTAAAAYEKTKIRVAELQALGDQFDDAVANAVIAYVNGTVAHAISYGLASVPINYRALYEACADAFRSSSSSSEDIKQMTMRRFRVNHPLWPDVWTSTLENDCKQDHGHFLVKKYKHLFEAAGYVVLIGTSYEEIFTITWVQKQTSL